VCLRHNLLLLLLLLLQLGPPVHVVAARQTLLLLGPLVVALRPDPATSHQGTAQLLLQPPLLPATFQGVLLQRQQLSRHVQC
jgi:hypothetical protein